MCQTIISLHNVSAGYDGKTVLKDVNVDVNQNDFIGIIGPNGGGKTTLIKTILSIIPPISGEIVYRKNIKMGYLPQITTIDKRFPISALEVVCSGNVRQKTDYEAAEIILSRLSVAYLSNKQIGNLSGGELQRVLLARALYCKPEVLILDEPTTYVDNKFETKMYEILHELNSEMTILMVSHDLGMISRHVKSIMCVNKSVHYHNSNVITPHQLDLYECPMQLVEHGRIPHTVLEIHDRL